MTTVVSSVTTVPESVTTVVSSVTTVPESVTTVPESVTTVPESVTTVPESVTTVVSSVTTVPESVTTVVSSVTTVVDPFANKCGGLLPVEVPAACGTGTYTCAEIKEIFDYTEVRVAEHNTRRALHQNTNAVAYDLDIACQAKDWATHLAVNDAWEHAPADQRPGQGENLAYTASTPSQPGVYTPELGWYEGEIPFYNWATGGTTDPSEQVGHFTQMVWDDTTHIGCGEARISRVND